MDLSPEKIIEAYKDLADVERAFRNMKIPLELRPFFHHKEERVRAHVFISSPGFCIRKSGRKDAKR